MGYLNSEPRNNLIQQTRLHEMSVCLAMSVDVQNLPSRRVGGFAQLRAWPQWIGKSTIAQCQAQILKVSELEKSWEDPS